MALKVSLLAKNIGGGIHRFQFGDFHSLHWFCTLQCVLSTIQRSLFHFAAITSIIFSFF